MSEPVRCQICKGITVIQDRISFQKNNAQNETGCNL